ncbi:MAG: hypothetical protein IT379_00935 [Deltaproteobacteria bacterium]|nr:hypothetical protein [Deltaproteobacteria bacterium]
MNAGHGPSRARRAEHAAVAPVVLVALFASCGNASTTSPQTGDAPRGSGGDGVGPSAGADARDDSPTDDVEPASASRHGYAASPLSAFADAVTDVALAAVARGEASLPESPIAIEASGGDVERLRADADTTSALRAGRPEVLGLYLEVELYLTPTGGADAGPGAGVRRTDQLSLGLWLGAGGATSGPSRGVRVTLLRYVAGGAGAVSLPPAPSAIRAAVEPILAAIREGRPASEIAFADADRANVADRALGAQMRGGAPDDRALEPARAALATSPRIRAWAFDDLGVLVRAGAATVLLAMKITVDDTGLVLEAQPLVRAQRVGR